MRLACSSGQCLPIRRGKVGLSRENWPCRMLPTAAGLRRPHGTSSSQEGGPWTCRGVYGRPSVLRACGSPPEGLGHQMGPKPHLHLRGLGQWGGGGQLLPLLQSRFLKKAEASKWIRHGVCPRTVEPGASTLSGELIHCMAR